MKTICGWCNKVLKETGEEDDFISHGMCAECRDKILDELDKYFNKECDNDQK